MTREQRQMDWTILGERRLLCINPRLRPVGGRGEGCTRLERRFEPPPFSTETILLYTDGELAATEATLRGSETNELILSLS